MAYFVGIDLGGMSAKAALFDENGGMSAQCVVPTAAGDGFEKTADKLAELARQAAKDVGFGKVKAVGVASPGVVDSGSGRVLRWSNFAWEDVPLGEAMEKRTGKPAFVLNDANAAALGEQRFGSASGYKSSILITLGTGVGGGIVIDGKLVEGYMGAGAEIGHMTIRENGEKCSCGRRGCFERYASATALIAQTKKKMDKFPKSKLWQIAGSKENVDGKTAFEGMRRGDKAATEVIRKYVGYLAEGIADFVNILRPEAVLIGGGIAEAGEALFTPLRRAVDERSYVASDIVPLQIVGAALGNKAGMYGAYAFAKEAAER